MRQIYTTEEVCKILKISRGLLYAEMRDGNIVAFRTGRSYKFTEESVNAYIEKMTVRPDSIEQEDQEETRE